MEPIYADIACEDSFDGQHAGDEAKLLTSYNDPTRVKSRRISPKTLLNWLTRRLGNRDKLRGEWARLQQLRSSLLENPVILHFTLVLTYSILCFVVIHHSRELQGCPAVIYTPAQEAVSREAKVLSVKINQTSNIFNAEPSPEVDDAWASLFRYANIRVTKDEIERTGRPSVELNDGSGDSFGTLDVYHQLHCLKYIRQYVHQDYYKVRDTNVPVKEHVNHCIEMLRQVVMCKADTALMTYEWLSDFPGPWPNFGIQHECVNWEKIDNWSKERSIDIFDPKYLHHPKFGRSFDVNLDEDGWK
ncbi:hypothetical protein BKA65DRAFT_476878 [Rhexocercosporidium sp. MPI-PUGE-AT-0058]|nr:hypothetical protein BKA65DRAFT_476878 [Rhexocercosporidium sp. MPI-PUGE-AT-0058]